MAAGNSPAQLGADNVIRFVDVAHFLRELAGNLGRGRAFVRTRRRFELRSFIDVRIEAPMLDHRVGGRAQVVFNRDGFLGLEFEDFETELRQALSALGQAAEARVQDRPSERTVIAPRPVADHPNGGPVDPAQMPTPAEAPPAARAVQIHFDESDDGQAGSFVRHNQSASGLSAPRPRRRPAPAMPPPTDTGRRRRPYADDLRDLETSVDADFPAATTADAGRSAATTADAGRSAATTADAGRSAATTAEDTRLASDLELFDAILRGAGPDGAHDEVAPDGETPHELPALSPTDDAGVSDLGAAHSGDDVVPVVSTEPVAPNARLEAPALLDPRWTPIRMTEWGVLRVTSAADLLGLYLCSIRHGTLTVFGGPNIRAGDRTTIKIVGHRAVEVSATAVARVGDWLTLAFQTAEPLRAMLAEAPDAWQNELEALDLISPSAADTASSNAAVIELGPPPQLDVPTASRHRRETLAIPSPGPASFEPFLSTESTGDIVDALLGPAIAETNEGTPPSTEAPGPSQASTTIQTDSSPDRAPETASAATKLGAAGAPSANGATAITSSHAAASGADSTGAKTRNMPGETTKTPEHARSAASTQIGPMGAADADVGPMGAADADVGPMGAADADVGPTSAADAEIDPMGAADADVGPMVTADAEVGPTSPAGTQIGPTSPAGTQVGPTSPAGTQIGPMGAADAEVGPTSPAGTQIGPMGAADAEVGPTSPAGTQIGPMGAADAEVGPTSPTGTQVTAAAGRQVGDPRAAPRSGGSAGSGATSTRTATNNSTRASTATTSASAEASDGPSSDTISAVAAHEPQPPRLEGGLVIFERKEDLVHELETTLKNGGLFVASEPLEIRSKQRLQVKVAGDLLPVTLETDVVFADGGRVGFSVANTPGAQNDLRRYLAGELQATAVASGSGSDDPSAPRTGALTTTDVDDLNKDAVSSADLQAFAGTLIPSLSNAELLRLQETRIEDPSQLGSVSALHLFEYVIRQQWKGVLSLRMDDQLRKVWIHEGSVAYIASEPYEESTSLGRILVTLKKVTEVNLREGLEKSKQTGRSLGRSLVLLGSVKRTDITGALREQVRLKMDSAFGWPRGRYEWTPWTEPPGQADLVLTRGIGVMARHVRGRLDHLNISEVEQLFGRGLARTVAHAANVDTIATSLQLAPRDLRFLELQIDGTRSVNDGVLGSPLGRLASLRLVALGLTLGFVRYTDSPSTQAPVSPRQDSAVPGESKIRKELQERMAIAQTQNHFERLGVHWSAHHRSYRAAYDAVIADLSISKPPLRDVGDEIKALARQLKTVLEESFKALDDAQTRAQYRKKLFDKTEREYAADMLIKQGEVALMRGDRMQAIECLETAVELDPSQRNRGLLTSARGGRG